MVLASCAGTCCAGHAHALMTNQGTSCPGGGTKRKSHEAHGRHLAFLDDSKWTGTDLDGEQTPFHPRHHLSLDSNCPRSHAACMLSGAQRSSSRVSLACSSWFHLKVVLSLLCYRTRTNVCIVETCNVKSNIDSLILHEEVQATKVKQRPGPCGHTDNGGRTRPGNNYRLP